jgi:hypothetical protein
LPAECKNGQGDGVFRAASTDQRMVWVSYSGMAKGSWGARRGIEKHSGQRRASFCACVVSIGVHLTLLTVFGVLRFSGSVAQMSGLAIPAARVEQKEDLPQAASVIPKPKVKRAEVKDSVRGGAGFFPGERIFGDVKQGPESSEGLWKSSVSLSSLWSPRPEDLAGRPGLFGSFSERRKVCYLVDCSGSMRGVFGRVREELKESIGNLQADEYFYIIFFGGDRLFEFGDGSLVRATLGAKSSAQRFIDSVGPAGQTNALAALERAVQIRDGRGEGSSVIYFLTDGFELAKENEGKFLQEAGDLLGRFVPVAMVNVIGFWPQGGDRKMLQAMAKQGGGEFVLIEGDM